MIVNVRGNRGVGIILVLTAAIAWGVSGTVAQFLFQEKGFSAQWLVVVRLFSAGLLLIAFSAIKGDKNVWIIWRDKQQRIRLISFGIFGMLAVQYTYFAAIETGNAATATLLQFLGPVFITGYLSLKTRTIPGIQQIIAMGFALFGTFLLVTNGNIGELSISGIAVFWGISSAIALAVYTLQPIVLLKQYSSAVVIGWAMIIGGFGLSIIQPPWQMTGEVSTNTILSIIFVILFGTLLAFYCYLESLKYLTATETSLFTAAEPLTAAILAVIWLDLSLGMMEWLGAFCIIFTIILLSRSTSVEKIEVSL